MGRTKVHASADERHASYRERLAQDRDDLKELRAKAQGKELPQEPEAIEGMKWFKVAITFDRKEMKAPETYHYVMEENHLLRLQSDLRTWKEKMPDAAYYGTYAYADSSDMAGIPGTITVMFDGVTVTNTSIIPDGYAPPPCYDLSDGTVHLLMTRRVRYGKQ